MSWLAWCSVALNVLALFFLWRAVVINRAFAKAALRALAVLSIEHPELRRLGFQHSKLDEEA